MQEVCRLVVEAQMRNIQLFTAVRTIKDCYFLVNAELKRMERAERGRCPNLRLLRGSLAR